MTYETAESGDQVKSVVNSIALSAAARSASTNFFQCSIHDGSAACLFVAAVRRPCRREESHSSPLGGAASRSPQEGGPADGGAATSSDQHVPLYSASKRASGCSSSPTRRTAAGCAVDRRPTRALAECAACILDLDAASPHGVNERLHLAVVRLSARLGKAHLLLAQHRPRSLCQQLSNLCGSGHVRPVG